MSEGKTMADKYVISGGQQGAVGDNAVAHDFTMNSNSAIDDVDLAALTQQLSLIRQEAMAEAMKTGAPGDAIAAGKIAEAEAAASEGDKAKAMASLKACGKWALELATKVGASLLENLLKKELGLP
jgi:hypothetical protein